MASELERVAQALAAAPGGAVPVLVTLMSVAGSAYRGPGARMVVLGDDTTVGAISGGCLEKDIVAHAAKARATGGPLAVTYDLTRDDDAPWGLNMGCNAKLDVLLEPCPGGPPAHLAFALDHLAVRTPVVVSTLFQKQQADRRAGGQRDATVGDRALMAGNDAPVRGTLADGPLGGTVRGDANRVMDEERSDVVTYPVAGGAAQVLHEYLPRPLRLVACGEGEDIAPLVRLGAGLGWQTVTVGRDDALPELDDRTAAIVMTHNYGRDAALLAQLLPSRARYVGVLGPRSRTERLLQDLAAGNRPPNPGQLLRLHAPVGLDIGAETPEEVALAIAAEVRAHMSGRTGGRLKERKGAIHDRR